ncbi:M4 family metallopeptidase [Dyadobacter psychrotolerans]|uniref:T9SS type A sorting domain-containing protein n=1 Tax=Dyadobacter psychrotolerans TaxID=2541721 RepID=A0A4R5DD16_9BACT|nr:M4 family metallopeptidase [Dyadobacter psychrotolerans]TDE11639.1 T9SS type A sorting domain-containing protein [Dyadobacter psychrotolerans]
MKCTLQFILGFILCAFTAVAQDAVKNEVNSFTAKTGAVATIGKATNSVNFIRFPAANAIKLSGSAGEDKALLFVKQNTGLFKAKWDKEAYQVKESRKDNYGLEHVALQQYVEGVPVFDGVLKFHFNRSADLSSMNGNFISVPKLKTVASISPEEAASAAIKYVTGQKFGQFAAPLKVNKNTLYIFQKGLAQGYQGRVHLVYEVEVANDLDVREYLYVDAHSKELVEQFTGMHSIDRKVYETSISGVNLKWQESNGTSGAAFNALDVWQKSEVVSAGHIYNLMKNTFGHNSYDNAGATMITINNNPDINCPNATWNGRTANYCTGTASDDVVAHEWAHAYTEYTSGLIYAWQAGALNEAYSDIWGETVDQLNNYMDESESADARTGCGSSARWKLGEKTTAFGGALRDMWDPNCEGDPGKVSDPQYWCSAVDNGGVHINSGILNHAYALLVDGGTYNGQKITGLGLTKAAHIFWRAQSHYMTSTTDFASQADILEASLLDLVGVNLPALSTSESAAGLSGETITTADAEQLAKVIAAVELRLPNACGFPKLLADVPTICSGALPESAIFYESFENGLSNWTVSSTGSGQNWTARNWVLKSPAPGGRSGNVVFGIDLDAGDCINNFQNGLISIASPVISIPAGSSGPFNMAFDHFVATESGYDGGNIKYRINGGAWILLPASAFTANGYNKILVANSGNPLQGQPGFSGADDGSVGGSWGQSRIDLSKLGLVAGQTIQFQWDFGTDGCGGLEGWYLDDIRVYSCATPSVQFVTTSTTVNEGEATIESPAPNSCLKYVEKTVVVKINKAPSQPVTITFNLSEGTAKQGATADYNLSPSSFVLHAGNLSQEIKVRIYDDAYVEESETFTLTYSLNSSSGGDAYAELFNQSHTFTITDNDKVPTIVGMTLVSEDFEQGMPAGWNVVGGGTYPSAWSVALLPSVSLDPAKPKLLFINSDAAGMVTLDRVVESAPFNTVGMSNINLSFLEYFYVWPSSFAEQGLVDVWDGTAWRNVLTQNQATGTSGSWTSPAQRSISIPAAYANPLMKIRFRYIANYDYWWGIDNVKITAESPKQIQTTVSLIPDDQYLGPNSTVHFYDPASGNLMARINNFSNHDYGCTTVAVDREGVDATNWQGNSLITNKTFKVTPAYNDPAGSYEITLYYRSSELPNFNVSKIKSMGKSSSGIMSATAANLNYSKIQVSEALTAGLAFTSTFNTGFSGFGLSNVTPPEALPVRLIAFEGRNTAEGNMLAWSTSEEVRHDRFEIERSADSKHFTEVGRISGYGNSNELHSYQYLDSKPAGGITYYRLKQIDTDGTFAYSKIISVDGGILEKVIFYPNPVQSLLSIELPDKTLKEVDLKIVNSAGQEILRKENVKTGSGSFIQDIHKLPSGIYHVIISTPNSGYSFSVFKF